MLEYVFAVLEWCKVTIFLRDKNKKILFKEGEIWWCSIGMNVGVEVYGKGLKFTRPVLIFKKFNADSFLGIPLTSKIKNEVWYAPLHCAGVEVRAILSQARSFDAKRLTERMGTVTEVEFKEARKLFSRYYGSDT